MPAESCEEALPGRREMMMGLPARFAFSSALLSVRMRSCCAAKLWSAPCASACSAEASSAQARRRFKGLLRLLICAALGNFRTLSWLVLPRLVILYHHQHHHAGIRHWHFSE